MSFDPQTHNGYVTIENPATGNHRVLRIWAKKFGGEQKRVAGLMTGPNRSVQDDWTDFAFVGDDGRIRLWKRFVGTDFAAYVKLLEKPCLGEAKGLIYRIEGRCRVCNRPLTAPQSIDSGIGPECSKK